MERLQSRECRSAWDRKASCRVLPRVYAGFNRWKSLGRFVKKGEKGIAIFARCEYKTKIETEDGEEKSVQQIRGFRVVHVFDIPQTEGEELPGLAAGRPKLLDGDAPEGIWDALVCHAESIGYEVLRHWRGSENGYCDFLRKRSSCDPTDSRPQAVKDEQRPLRPLFEKPASDGDKLRVRAFVAEGASPSILHSWSCSMRRPTSLHCATSTPLDF
jgi:hypothetical protein